MQTYGSETAEPVSSELLLFPQPAITTVISKAAMVTAMVVLAKAALNFLYRKGETYVSPCYQKIEIFYHRIYRIFRSKEPHFSGIMISMTMPSYSPVAA